MKCRSKRGGRTRVDPMDSTGSPGRGAPCGKAHRHHSSRRHPAQGYPPSLAAPAGQPSRHRAVSWAGRDYRSRLDASHSTRAEALAWRSWRPRSVIGAYPTSGPRPVGECCPLDNSLQRSTQFLWGVVKRTSGIPGELRGAFRSWMYGREPGSDGGDWVVRTEEREADEGGCHGRQHPDRCLSRDPAGLPGHTAPVDPPALPPG